MRRDTKCDSPAQANGVPNSQGSSPQGQGQGQTAQVPRQKKMSFKAASQATLTFLTARKRIEDGLKNLSKRRMSKRGSIEDGKLTWTSVVTSGSIVAALVLDNVADK